MAMSNQAHRGRRVSRRAALRLMGLATISLAAACAPGPAPAPTSTPAQPAGTPEPTIAPTATLPVPPAPLVTATEVAAKDAWAQEWLFGARAPFSFVYGDLPSATLLPTWTKEARREAIDARRTKHTLTWTDEATGLQVRCEAVDYADYPVVEWTVWFANTHASANTPILKAVRGMDIAFEQAGGDFTLRRWLGDSSQPKSYQPFTETLTAGAAKEFGPVAGRPTNSDAFPYFNLQRGDSGWIVVIGWPGQWRAKFSRQGAPGLQLTAGQDGVRLSLKPGESIRTSLNVLLFWQGGDVVRSQNIWRRWFMAHNLPRTGGRPTAPLTHLQLPNAEQGLYTQVKAYEAAGVPIDVCWRDAGWYPCGGDWTQTGTWEIDRNAFPNGFRPFTDWLHPRGKKMILWWEPERVRPGTWLHEQHPEWLLTFPGAEQSLLNLGNPDARRWLTDHVDAIMTREGIDHYRQDFNTDPRYYWTSNDAPDREGLVENLYVQGYLAYWDELRRRRPGMIIDSCASGGRRNDLETLRRGVPLLRSDFQFGADTSLGNQGHTYGLASWISYHGTATYALGNYDARSFYTPAFGVGIDVDPAEARRYYEECRQIAPYMLGDYYPLTPYNLDPALWIAWQFDHPELGGGFVQAFRREQSAEAQQVYRLRGLDASAHYTVIDADTGATNRVSGETLLSQGLTVTIDQPRDAALVHYRREPA